MKDNGNVEWHELNLNDKIRFKINKEDSLIVAEVLSFRKLNAIVLCEKGGYELLSPEEFNNYYRTEVIQSS